MYIPILLLTATVVAAPAASEPPPTHEDADAAARVSSHGDVSVYEFADDTLTGEHLSPDGSLIPWRRPPHHVSLIDLRGHFIPELVTLGLDV